MSIRDRLRDPQLIRDINCGILDGLRLRHGLTLGHVLLVAPDPIACGSLRDTLRRAGYRVTTETSAAQVIETVRRRQPEMVLVDLTGEGGAAIVAVLRVHGQAKVVAFASGGSPRRLGAARALGAHDVLLDPDDPQDVLEIVRDVLELPSRTSVATSRRTLRREAAG